MKKLILFLLFIPALVIGQVIEKLPISSSNAQGYVVSKPSDVSTEGLPCIIHLHGVGGQGDGSSAQLQRIVDGELPKKLQAASQKYKFVIIAPQVSGWNYNAAIAYCRSVAINTYKVDPDQIHLWGLSAGGSGVTGYTSSSVSNASQFATAVVSCGVNGMGQASAKNIADAKLPMIFFHANEDETVNVSNTNNAVAWINGYAQAFPAKKVIYISKDHGIWDRVYDPNIWPWIGNESQGLYEWALSCRRGQPKAVPEIAPSTEMIVNAGEDFTTATNKIKLDGSKSTNWKSATWRAISAPAGISLWNVNACAWITCENVLLPATGVYVFELKLTDVSGASKTDTIIVTYGTDANPPVPPAKTIVARLFVAGFEVIVYSDKTAEVK